MFFRFFLFFELFATHKLIEVETGFYSLSEGVKFLFGFEKCTFLWRAAPRIHPLRYLLATVHADFRLVVRATVATLYLELACKPLIANALAFNLMLKIISPDC
jgi:hypothetical protein